MPGVYDGSQWVDAPAHVYDGSNWTGVAVRVYDGTQWVTVEGTSDSTDGGGGGDDTTSASIPLSGDWTDQGRMLTPGSGWDSNWHDCTVPSSLVTDGSGTWYCYYVAAEGTRADDGGPAYRRIGLATSTTPGDPTSWTKHPDNPILDHRPVGHSDNEEEEGFYGTAVIYRGGTFYLFGGALTATGSTSVRSDVKLWTSSDGVTFSGPDLVMAKEDDVYGSGDELFPLGVQVVDGTWYLYYSAVGSVNWGGGVAWGGSPLDIGSGSTEFYNPGEVYDGMDAVPLGDGNTGVFPTVGDVRGTGVVDALRVADTDPTTVAEHVDTYDPGNLRHGPAVARDGSTWYLPWVPDTEDEMRLWTATL